MSVDLVANDHSPLTDHSALTNHCRHARRHRWPHRLLVLATTLGVLVSGCGQAEPDGYDVADRVLAAIDQPTGQDSGVGSGEGVQALASTEEDCTVTEVEDEYGFITLVSSCGPETPATLADREPGPIEPTEVVAAGGDLPLWVLDELRTATPEQHRARLDPLIESVSALETWCGVDFDQWLIALADLTVQAEALSAVTAAGELGPYPASDPAKAMSRAIMERALLLTGCAEPGGGTAVEWPQLTTPGPLGLTALELTARAATAMTTLGQQLDGDLSTYLFHYFSTGPNYHWLRTQPTPLDVVVYGTSQAGAGIEVPVLADELSMLVGNAFLPGSLAEVQQHWFPEVERFADPATVVWLVGPIDLLIGCDTPGREAQFTDRLVRRQRTFRAPGWFAEVEHIDLLLGPASEVNTNRGNAAKKPAPDQAAIDAHLLDYRDQLSAPTFCADRAAVIGQSVARMSEAGRRVVIVGMPISPLAYAHLPGGPSAGSEALELLERRHLAAVDTDAGPDADIVDLSAAVQDPELWADYTHLTQDGANLFSTLLAEELRGLLE